MLPSPKKLLLCVHYYFHCYSTKLRFRQIEENKAKLATYAHVITKLDTSAPFLRIIKLYMSTSKCIVCNLKKQ